MFSSIRNRLIVIALLIGASIYFLFPRTITTRERGPDGVMHDVTTTAVPLKRGLDLQGGMHLELELDQSKQVSADPKRDIELALTVLRKRIDEFGVTEPVIQKVGSDRIVVELAGVTDPARATAIVQRSAFLDFRITDKTNALAKALPSLDRAVRGLGVTSIDTANKPAKPSAVQELLGAADTAKKAADSTARAGKAGAKADTAATPDTAPVTGGVLSSLIQPAPTGIPGAYMVPESAFPRVDSLLHLPAVERVIPRNIVLKWAAQPTFAGGQAYRLLYALEDKSMITGQYLVDAQARLDPLTNAPEVGFTLDRAGGRKFLDGTSRHVGDYMAIILDDRVQGGPPVIESAIGREGRITLAGKTIEEARDLALTLKAGALPTPLKIVASRQVNASLGADSIHKGITAGLVGTILVIVIMVGYYRLSGVLSVLALGIYLLFTLGGLAMVDATLTLPGLAGIVLSIGMAVDANVLIFERIREELQAGKTVRLSVDEGFRHAMSAIIDSNVSTVLTALFLFQFGTGPVKGFAVTLTLGVIASMITAVFVTRTFFMIWLQRKPAMSTLSI
ncbi:MAG TPA: protein translocase subunit SecD [Gemmatimonadales bacterium]|nr:protein translocase subunit SecD [Gemmatimonadales bacterium]